MSFENISVIVRRLYPSANDLARAAGVNYPLNNESPGAQWLYRVRDYLDEDWGRILESDEPYGEIGWDALETNTYQQWLIFADLELWNYDAETIYETAEFPARNFRVESHRVIKVDDIPNLAESLLGEISNSLLRIILHDVQEYLRENETDE